VCWRVCARLPLARLRGSAPRRRCRKVFDGTNRGIPKSGAPEPSSTQLPAWGRVRSRSLEPFWSCGPAPGGSRRRSITGFPFFVFGGKKLGGRAHARGAHGAGSAPGRRRVSWRAGRCRGAPRLTELCAPRPVALAAASITGFLFFGGKPSGLLRPTNRPFAAAAAAARSDGGTERSGWGSIATSHAPNGVCAAPGGSRRRLYHRLSFLRREALWAAPAHQSALRRRRRRRPLGWGDGAVRLGLDRDLPRSQRTRRRRAARAGRILGVVLSSAASSREGFVRTYMLGFCMELGAVCGGEEIVVDRWYHHLLVFLLVFLLSLHAHSLFKSLRPSDCLSLLVYLLRFCAQVWEDGRG
jgi:hypothetical protein